MRQASGALITRQPTTHAAIQINESPSWQWREFAQQEAEMGSKDGDGCTRQGCDSKPGDTVANCRIRRMKGGNLG